MKQSYIFLAVECPDPFVSKHTYVVFPKNETYQYGDQIELNCDSGYEINGINTFSCNANRSWGSLAVCRGILNRIIFIRIHVYNLLGTVI